MLHQRSCASRLCPAQHRSSAVCRHVCASTRSLASTDLSSKSTVTYIHRSVREDEHVEAPGSVVVWGNVAADASIEAAGDVMVWGRLSGHVHAGCSGDRSATISALELRGAQLIIAQSTSLGAARITVPGPHTASVVQVGRSITMNLTPLGPSHPPLNPIGLTSSVKRWFDWYPAAAAALITGCYALLAGCALVVAPKTVLGLLFDASTVPSNWIRVGGVLFATFGAQYLGTAIADYRQVLTASHSSSGCPDMPFRPASPHPVGIPPQQQPHTAPAAVAATFQSHPTGPLGLSSTASAMLHDSSSAYVDFSSTGSTNGSVGSSSSSSGDALDRSDISKLASRSVPADKLTKDEIEQLRQSHKRRHKAAAAAAAAARDASATMPAAAGGGGAASSQQVSSSSKQGTSSSMLYQTRQQQQQQATPQQFQQQQQHQQQPPTWAYCSSGFYEASVWARLALAVAFAVLVAVCKAPAGLLVLALVNILGALSMWGALRRQWLMHVMGDLPEAAGVTVSAS